MIQTGSAENFDKEKFCTELRKKPKSVKVIYEYFTYMTPFFHLLFPH